MFASKAVKAVVLAAVDLVICLLAWFCAYFLRFDFAVPHLELLNSLHALPLVLLAYFITFFLCKIPFVIWRFAGLQDLVRLLLSVLCGLVLAVAFITLVFSWAYLPHAILPLHALFYLLGLFLSRYVYVQLRRSRGENIAGKRVLIIGAGEAAESLLHDLQRPRTNLFPIGLLDDNPALKGKSLLGIEVLGSCADLAELLAQQQIDLVFFAIPSCATPQLLTTIVSTCNAQKVELLTLPGMRHLLQSRISVDALRKVSIEDLLGRDPVNTIDKNLGVALAGKIVVVTGGGGSIGSELCLQLAENNPSKLVIVDNTEFNLYSTERKIKQLFPNLEVVGLLIDVSCADDVLRELEVIKPNIIFHAAAYKHVPMLEDKILVAAKNNIIGTKIVADAANELGVESFVLISTDKAVNPTNIMGTTKRIAEIYCQALDKRSATNFITVRFGNVLGSTGSVLPLFKQQLEAGGPLTVTDANMERFFMMIPEAVLLILQAFLLGSGGEIFVLEMGRPIKILELAEKFISLAGRVPYQDVDIQITGIRPGEKLYEEVFHAEEDLTATQNQKILQAQSREYQYADVKSVIVSIEQAVVANDDALLLDLMLRLVPEYNGAKSN